MKITVVREVQNDESEVYSLVISEIDQDQLGTTKADAIKAVKKIARRITLDAADVVDLMLD